MPYHSASIFLCLCVLLQGTGTLEQNPCFSSLNPTGNLREVVIAKCTVYQEIVNQAEFCDGNTFAPRNCTELWEKFSSAFLYQPRCNVLVDRYEDFINLTHHPVPKDKSLFWENVYPFVHRFSNKGAKYFTLSDTLTGYIGNQLQWCSDPDNGMSEAPTECPEWEPTPTCNQSAQRAFWIAASRSFGLRATGEIQIMFNASSDPIYADSTYFAVYELPYLQENVTKATVLLINENPVKGRTRCADQSLGVFARKMQARGIQYECVENRRDVAQLLCLDNPQSNVCSVLEPETSGATSVYSSLFIIALLAIV